MRDHNHDLALTDLLRYAPLSGVSLHTAFEVSPSDLAYNDQITDPDAMRWLLGNLPKFASTDINNLVLNALNVLDPQEVTAVTVKDRRIAGHHAAWPHYSPEQRAEVLALTKYKAALVDRVFFDGDPVADDAIAAALAVDGPHFPAAKLAAVSPDCATDLAVAAFLAVVESEHEAQARYRAPRLACQRLLMRPEVFDELMTHTWNNRILNSHELTMMALLNVPEPYATYANDLMIASLEQVPFAERELSNPYDFRILSWPIVMWPRNDKRLFDMVFDHLDPQTAHPSMTASQFLGPLRDQMYQRLMSSTPLSASQPEGVPDPLTGKRWPFFAKFRDHISPDVRLTPDGWQEAMGWLKVLQASIPNNSASSSSALKRELTATVFQIVAPILTNPAATAHEIVYSGLDGLALRETPTPLIAALYADLGVEMPPRLDRTVPQFKPPPHVLATFEQVQGTLDDDPRSWREFYTLLDSGLSPTEAATIAGP